MQDLKDHYPDKDHRMTIVLAEADIQFRDRPKKRLERITGVYVVGESSDSEETTAMILNRKPKIAILNSSLRDGHSIEVLRHIKRLMVPPTMIVVSVRPFGGQSDRLLSGLG